MDKNAFGGGNPNGLYVPMSEVEQEAVSRLVSAKDLRVIIVGWGHHDSPSITFGDARVQIQFRTTFNKPEIPMGVRHFDLELHTHSGELIFKSRESVVYGGQPLLVGAGLSLDMVWDIQIKAMDPALVKRLVPSAIGLTSRRIDKDTKAITTTGNMQVNDTLKTVLRDLERRER